MVTKNSNGVRCERAVAAVLQRSADVRVGADGSGADLVVNGQSMRVAWAGDGQLGDVRRVPLPAGEIEYEVLEISYPI